MLAVATARRLDAAPDVPTVAEALGLASFEAVLWHAVFAPPALPAPILERLSAATNAALADPAFRASLAASGITASAPGTPASAAAFIAAETARYRRRVSAATSGEVDKHFIMRRFDCLNRLLKQYGQVPAALIAVRPRLFEFI